MCQVYLKLHIELPNIFDFLQDVTNVTHEQTQDLADTGDQKFGLMEEILEMSKYLFGKGVGQVLLLVSNVVHNFFRQ